MCLPVLCWLWRLIRSFVSFTHHHIHSNFASFLLPLHTRISRDGKALGIVEAHTSITLTTCIHIHHQNSLGFIHSFIHSFILSQIHSFIHPFIHPFSLTNTLHHQNHHNNYFKKNRDDKALGIVEREEAQLEREWEEVNQTYLYLLIYICVCVCMKVCGCGYLLLCTLARAHTHTFIHTYIHTYTHTVGATGSRAQVLSFPLPCLRPGAHP
jgi:hypothetical protein